ncbi:MAG: 2,3-bisphosphoglycerate-independent phosphoglycerate mutase, partial [bacterium]
MKPSSRAPGALVILDGWGARENRDANAILQAKTPVMSGLLARYPHTLISASAESVGLPPGQMGNSEVGHMVMGAGRIVPQMFTVITTAVRDGTLKKNAVLRAACAKAVSSGT